MFRKEGEAYAPTSPSPEGPEKPIGGKTKKLKGGVFKNVNKKTTERFYID
jgi:hypothetical protein